MFPRQLYKAHTLSEKEFSYAAYYYDEFSEYKNKITLSFILLIKLMLMEGTI